MGDCLLSNSIQKDFRVSQSSKMQSGVTPALQIMGSPLICL